MASQLVRRRRELEDGAEHLGWKLGVGNEAGRKLAGTSGPLVGFFTDRNLLRPGATVEVGDMGLPLLEPEIAVFLGADPGPEPSREEALAAITGIRPGLELLDLQLDVVPDVERLVAENIFQRHMIYGPDVVRRGAETAHVEVRVSGGPEDLVGQPEDQAEAIAYLARYLAAFDLSLSAGEIVMTGQVIDPQPIPPGTELEFDYGELGTIGLKTR